MCVTQGICLVMTLEFTSRLIVEVRMLTALVREGSLAAFLARNE